MDNLKPFKFEIFSDKDMFECKLSAITPDFGYVTNAERKYFFDFLLKMQFLKIVPPKALPGFGNRGIFLVVQGFQYAGMDLSSPKIYNLKSGMCFSLTKSMRVNERTMGMGIDA